MAKDKKAFILYCDILETFKLLSLEDRGKVITWILEYVNDNNPKPLPGLLSAVVEPIKQQLKRDLKKYEARAERSRENGKKGGRPKNPKKPDGFSGNLGEPKEPDKDIGIDTDTVIDIESTKVDGTPLIDEFVAYGIEKLPTVDVDALRLKYNSWMEQGWKKQGKNGKLTKIINWKSTLLNTLPYLKRSETITTVPNRPNIDPLVAHMALSIPAKMQELIDKGWTKKEIQEVKEGKHTGV